MTLPPKNISRICIVGTAIAMMSSCRTAPQEKETKYLKRGQEQLAKKDYSRALLDFKNAAQTMPKDPEPYYQSGLAYLATQNIPSAAAPSAKALYFKPTQ